MTSTSKDGAMAGKSQTGTPSDTILTQGVLQPLLPTIAIWEELGSGQQLGTFRDGAMTNCLVARFFIAGLLADMLNINIKLLVRAADGIAKVGSSVIHAADRIGPATVQPHRSSEVCRVLGRKHTTTPHSILGELDKCKLDGALEISFHVRHAPTVIFPDPPPRSWLLKDADAESIRLMQSLSRATHIRLFFPSYIKLDLENIAGRIEATPISPPLPYKSMTSYKPGVEKSWKQYRVVGRDGTISALDPEDETDYAKPQIKRARPAVDAVEKHAKADNSHHQQKRLRPNPLQLPPAASHTSTNNAHFSPITIRPGNAVVQPGVRSSPATPATPRLEPNAPPFTQVATTTASPSTHIVATNAEDAGAEESAFTRIKPTTDLGRRWAEWWQFTYGDLGADTTDMAYSASMERMTRAVRNDDAADFAAGMVESALYSLDIDVDKTGAKAKTD